MDPEQLDKATGVSLTSTASSTERATKSKWPKSGTKLDPDWPKRNDRGRTPSGTLTDPSGRVPTASPARSRRSNWETHPSSLRSHHSTPASNESIWSLPTLDPTGGVRGRHWFKRTQLEPNDELVRELGPDANGKWRTLSLTAGQGGTFGYGDRFLTETGEIAKRDQPSCAKTKHLTYYGRDMEFIGTKDCYTCVGVYFEIKGNRVFCAHVNSWHDPHSADGTSLATRSKGYTEIADSVLERLRQHAREYDWTPQDIILDSVLLVCPVPAAVGYAVPHAVCEFLGLPDSYPIKQAHGFIVRPGTRMRPHNGLQMKLLIVELEIMEQVYVNVYEDEPDEVEAIPYVRSDGIEMPQEWTYTATIGWHHIPSDSAIFRPPTATPAIT